MNTHGGVGYRDPDCQSQAMEENLRFLLETLNDDDRTLVQDHIERLYARFVVAVDVGFEMGFAAARSLP